MSCFAQQFNSPPLKFEHITSDQGLSNRSILAIMKDSKGFLVATPNGLIPLMNGTGISSKTGNPSFVNAPSTNGMNQNYKALQYLYAAKTFKNTKVAALFLADHFGKYITDSVKNISDNDTGYIYGKRFNQKKRFRYITFGKDI